MAMGEASGEGDSEGNEVKLLSDGVGAWAFASEAWEAVLRGFVRRIPEADLRLPDEVDCMDGVRRRGASKGGSMAASKGAGSDSSSADRRCRCRWGGWIYSWDMHCERPLRHSGQGCLDRAVGVLRPGATWKNRARE